MFTIEQIKTAHSKVKSGADFPNYIRDIMNLGVTGYETCVMDGHSIFFGKEGYHTQWEAKYLPLTIATTSYPEKFTSELKAHQQGKTDYLSFCRTAAETGVEKWVVNLEKMTCTYFDKAGGEVLVESIPEA